MLNPDSQYAHERLGFMLGSLDIEVHLVAIMIHELTRHPVNPHTLAEAHDRLASLNDQLRQCQRALRNRSPLPRVASRAAPPRPMAPILDQELYDDGFNEARHALC